MTHEELAKETTKQIMFAYSGHEYFVIILDAIQKAVAPLEQEIAALKKDKERLDWMLSQVSDFYTYEDTWHNGCRNREELDELMKEGK